MNSYLNKIQRINKKLTEMKLDAEILSQKITPTSQFIQNIEDEKQISTVNSYEKKTKKGEFDFNIKVLSES